MDTYSISVPDNISDSAGNQMNDGSSNILYIDITSSGITAGTYQVGAGTRDVNKAPLYGLYDYSQMGVIYTASEIQAAIASTLNTTAGTSGGTISSLFFQYAGWTTGYERDNQTVKISHTSVSNLGTSAIYPDYREITITNTTTVKQNFTFSNPSSESWEEIGDHVANQSAGFDTNFIWNGTSNILISWENGDGDWTSGYGRLEGSNVTNRYTRFWYNDGSPNQGTAGINNTAQDRYVSRIPGIRLVFS